VPNYCPGASNIQCCIASCNTGTAKGNCAWTGTSCGEAFVPNFCPGPDDVQCCPSASAVESETVPPASSVTQTQTVVDTPPGTTGKVQSSNGGGDSTAAETTSPSYVGTAGSSQSSGGGSGGGTPVADANSSAGSPYYPGNTLPTTTSKNPTANLKTGGSGSGASDLPSPSGLDVGSTSGSAAPRSPKHISSGAIAGLTLGVLAIAAVAGSAIWLIRKKKKEVQGHQIQEISEGSLVVVGQRVGHELDGSPRVSVLSGCFVTRRKCLTIYSMKLDSIHLKGHLLTLRSCTRERFMK